jgi:16S rRNA (cytidine1402-2'-O)-methyltransferase
VLKNQGQIYICATPIGNLDDCSFRLIHTLKAVPIIAAEDTRKSKILLQKFKIQAKLISLQKYNEQARLSFFKQKLSQGLDIAILSDAGTPNISDPSAHITNQLLKDGFKVTPIPGPSAITALISCSGILANQFFFAGFFPKKKQEAENLLTQLLCLNIPIIFFESAKRLLKTLSFLENFPNIPEIFLAKELTKLHETHYFGTISEVKNILQPKTHNAPSLKGEWCFMLKATKLTAPLYENKILELQKLGLDLKQAAAIGTKFMDIPKNEIKRLYYGAH